MADGERATSGTVALQTVLGIKTRSDRDLDASISAIQRGKIAQMPNFRCDVSLLNDDHTPMEFVVGVLERFFEMSNDEAITQMFRIHNEGKASCGTYLREEAEKKVADVLGFAAKHKHPLRCILEQRD